MFKNIGLSFGWKKNIGLVTFWFDRGDRSYNIFLLPRKQYWKFGYIPDFYDGPAYYFGCGPLFLIYCGSY